MFLELLFKYLILYNLSPQKLAGVNFPVTFILVLYNHQMLYTILTAQPQFMKTLHNPTTRDLSRLMIQWKFITLPLSINQLPKLYIQSIKFGHLFPHSWGENFSRPSKQIHIRNHYPRTNLLIIRNGFLSSNHIKTQYLALISQIKYGNYRFSINIMIWQTKEALNKSTKIFSSFIKV